MILYCISNIYLMVHPRNCKQWAIMLLRSEGKSYNWGYNAVTTWGERLRIQEASRDSKADFSVPRLIPLLVDI